MQNRLKVGIIGLGVGERHLSTLNQKDNIDVKVVCDVDHTKRTILKNYSESSHFTTSADEVLESDVDLVVIASFDSDHASQVNQAIKNKKHVFVEKPLCLTREELQTIKSTVRQNPGFEVSTNFILRREPRIQNLKRKISSGALGDVYFLQASYDFGRFYKIQEGWRGKEEDHSAMLGGGIHMLDLAMWLTEQDFRPFELFESEIFSKAMNVKFQDLEGCIGHFKAGALGIIIANYGSRTKHFHQLKIYGTKGTFVQDFGKCQYMFGDDREILVEEVDDSFPSVEKGEILNGFIDYLCGRLKTFDILTDQVVHVMDRALDAIGR